MTEDDEKKGGLRDRLRRRLLSASEAIPTSSLQRIGRTAKAAWRTRGLIREATSGDGIPLDLESAERLVASIGELKGIAMKTAQILSYADVALPPAVQEALSVLQTHAQPMPFSRVRTIVLEELGPRGERLLETMEPTPVAAASIGQVHRATLPSSEGGSVQVAVKIRYPEVEKAIESDFRAATLGPGLARLLFPGAKIQDLVDEARSRFLEECDYEHEAAMTTRFGALFTDHPDIIIPEVYDEYVSRSVLTTRFLVGQAFDDFLESAPSQARRDRVGRTLFELYLGPLLRHGLYNCDPHPGNYLLLDGDRIGALDYGCTRVFEPSFVAKLRRLTEATYADDRDELHAAFVELGMVREGKAYDFATARDLVRSFYGPMLQDAEVHVDLGQAIGFRDGLRTKMELLKLTIPGEFVFLFRIRFGLMSALARLGARANWQALERSYLGAVLPDDARPLGASALGGSPLNASVEGAGAEST